jgi:hypothetical protein
VVFRNVFLHLWRLHRALSAWEIAGNDFWQDAFGAISQGVLLGMAAVMIIPSLMPFLSLVLPAGMNRWVNIVFGAVYSVIMILVITGGWHCYVLFGLIETTLTILVVRYAWTWPKQATR